MKKRTVTWCTVLLFAGFLACMLLGTILIPKDAFSQNEKRYLAELPAPDWSSVASGSWGEKLESWMADHIPLRNFFVGLDAYKNLALGQQQAGEIRLQDGRLAEAPEPFSESIVTKNLVGIQSFAQKVHVPVTLSLVPSAGWAAGWDGYSDDADIAEILSRTDGSWTPLNLTDIFSGHPEYYYWTDHHWNSLGAYRGYEAIAAHYGVVAVPESAFTQEVLPSCFQGSTYSRSALWLTEPEDLALWHGSEEITVTTSENDTPHGVFYRERLEEADKYTVFLDGNHALVRLTNPGKQGKLLVIRDSYSSILAPFLAESWGEVILADLRYYRQSLSALAAAESVDEILILYSLHNFLTDTNLVLLR